MIESAKSERDALVVAGKITGDIINILSNLCQNKNTSDRLIELEKSGIWIDGCFFIEFTYKNKTILLKLSNKDNENGDYTTLEFSFGYYGTKDMPIPTVKIKCLTVSNKILVCDIQNIIKRNTSLLHEIEHALLNEKLPSKLQLTPLKLPTTNKEYKTYVKNPKELDAYTKQILLWIDQILNNENINIQTFKNTTNIHNFLDSHGFYIHSKPNNQNYNIQTLKSLQQNWDEKNNKRILNKIYEQLKYLSELHILKKEELDDLYDYYLSLGLLNMAILIKTESEKRKNLEETTHITFMKYGYDELIDSTLNETINKQNINEEFSKTLNKKLREYFSDFDI